MRGVAQQSACAAALNKGIKNDCKDSQIVFTAGRRHEGERRGTINEDEK